MHQSPLREIQEAAQAQFMPYGPARDDGTDDADAIEMVMTFGQYEAEYAAVRKGVGVLDRPQRGVLEIAGKDRLDFLHNMVTHDTKTLRPGQGRRAFMLGKQGRIEADMILLEQDERMLVDLGIFQARALPAALDKYLFVEDVRIADVSDQWVHVALHGPQGGQLLAMLGADDVSGLEPLCHKTVTIAGASCLVYRRDECGSPGLHLLLPAERAAVIYQAISDTMGGLVPDIEAVGEGVGPKRDLVGRGIGWFSYNTARIEAGTPLFMVDFGTDCLPAETGVLDDAVSFTKGCYLGQEIVARMHSLGHPKRTLVGLRFDDDRLPMAGAQVIPADDLQTGNAIGAITSSTVAPMLGGKAVAFAMMKWGKHREGTKVAVGAEGEVVQATVAPLASMPSE